jgi:hypothetical protein
MFIIRFLDLRSIFKKIPSIPGNISQQLAPVKLLLFHPHCYLVLKNNLKSLKVFIEHVGSNISSNTQLSLVDVSPVM